MNILETVVRESIQDIMSFTNYLTPHTKPQEQIIVSAGIQVIQQLILDREQPYLKMNKIDEDIKKTRKMIRQLIENDVGYKPSPNWHVNMYTSSERLTVNQYGAAKFLTNSIVKRNALELSHIKAINNHEGLIHLQKLLPLTRHSNIGRKISDIYDNCENEGLIIKVIPPINSHGIHTILPISPYKYDELLQVLCGMRFDTIPNGQVLIDRVCQFGNDKEHRFLQIQLQDMMLIPEKSRPHELHKGNPIRQIVGNIIDEVYKTNSIKTSDLIIENAQRAMTY